MQTIQLIIPHWAICAIINGDESALNDEESKLLEQFTTKYSGYIIPCPDGEPEFMHYNDVDRYAGDCYIIEAVKFN